MTANPSVQSGEIPESPDGTPFVDQLPAPTVGAQMGELLALREQMTEALTVLREVHAMTLEAYQLMQSPAVAAMRKFQGVKRAPIFGGGRG